MTKTRRGRLLAVVALLLACVVPASAQQQPEAPPRVPPPTAGRPGQPPPPFSWWKSGPVKRELGLTADQVSHIDKIWETTRLELRQEWEELSKFEVKLSRLIQGDAEESVLARQIDRVETARASANKTRSLMLVQMRKVLTPEQRTRLDAIHERWAPDTQKQQPQTTPHDQPKPKQ